MSLSLLDNNMSKRSPPLFEQEDPVFSRRCYTLTLKHTVEDTSSYFLD